ncbi:MAG TPA: hypothetical protein VK474_07470 [Chthoniobacterales bacterium]|nr:hypothetical protein [Chthoniobacterales bacterium]
MKYRSQIISGACVAALVLSAAPLAFAAPKKMASPSPSASPAATESAAPAKAPRAIPFRGTATEIDQSAKTFTIAGKTNSRVFKVTDNTTVTKAGNPAAFADLTDNEAVTGSYWKHEDGTLEAKSLKIGGKSDAEKEASATRKAKKEEKKAAAAEESTAATPAPKK